MEATRIDGKGLIEPSGGDGVAEASASVMVVTKGGALAEASDYVVHALMGAYGAKGRVVKWMALPWQGQARQDSLSRCRMG